MYMHQQLKKMEEVKDELLEQNINQIANPDIKIILGDFNVKLVKKTYTNPPMAMKVYIMKPTLE